MEDSKVDLFNIDLKRGRGNEISLWKIDESISKRNRAAKPSLNEREKLYLQTTVEIIEQIGVAAHIEISARLQSYSTLFGNDKQVLGVEEQLIKKGVLVVTLDGDVSDRGLRPTDDIIEELKSRDQFDPRKQGTIEFYGTLPKWGMLLHIESLLVEWIKVEYKDITHKQISVIKNIIFKMTDNLTIAVLPGDVISLTLDDIHSEFDSWDDVKTTIYDLAQKQIVEFVYAGYEIPQKDGQIIRSMPEIHLMLQQNFACETIGWLNRIYLNSELPSELQFNKQYLVTPDTTFPNHVKIDW